MLVSFFVASLLILPLNLYFFWSTSSFGTEGISIAGLKNGRDFMNYWSGGHLASKFDAMTLYDLEAYRAWLTSRFGSDMNGGVFSYPPHMLVFLFGFGVLPHGVALLLWYALGINAFWFASFYRTKFENGWLSFALVATGSIVLFNILFGQLGLFLAAAFVGALRLLPTRPILAGVLLGLLTVKPQLGPLLVFTLLIRKDWLAICSALATAFALVLCSLVLWGYEPWLAYITTTLPNQSRLLQTMDGFFASIMTTPYAGFHALGMPTSVAMPIQLIISAAIAVTTVLVLLRQNLDWPLQALVITLGAALLTPYMLAYDMAIPLAALLWFASSRTEDVSMAESLLFTAMWSLCFSILLIFQMSGIPLFPVLLSVVYVLVVFRALSTQTTIQNPHDASV
jgi:hypothetical protein